MMKNILSKNVFFLLGFILALISCFDSKSKQETDPFATMTVEKKMMNFETVDLDIVLALQERRTLVFDGAVFTHGCPYYRESHSVFDYYPKLDELKHSQLLIENEKGQFKVFSSGLMDDGNYFLTNCAFIDSVSIALSPGKTHIFVVSASLSGLRTNKDDKKIRLHLFYKERGNEFIVSSDDWIFL